MKYSTVNELFTGICEAVRYKEGSSALVSHQDIPSRIMGLNSNESMKTMIELEIPIDEFSLSRISENDITVLENEGVTEVKLLDKSSDLGISSSSTAQEIFNATHGIIEVICNILGMVEVSQTISAYGWNSQLAFSEAQIPMLRIGFSNYNKGYACRYFYCSLLYTATVSNSIYGMSNPTDESVHTYCHSVDIGSSPLYLRYILGKNRNIAFDFHHGSDIGSNTQFILTDITHQYEDNVGSRTANGIIHTDGRVFVLSVNEPLDYDNNGNMTTAIPYFFPILSGEDCRILTNGNLAIGHNMVIDDGVRLISDCLSGDVIDIKGNRYIAVSAVNGYFSVVMQIQ